ncbi:MAG: class I SAM-dependent methyltransferase [Melioribacteraceae bacterium]|jgi:SAM-dependent methyltransferase|nr:class I SAM-dependent methyltransferase [Melioribacteraceae bacterium]
MENKFHWYDGKFYDKVIAPNQDCTFRIMRAMMNPNSSIIDIGTGTGRFVFQAAEKFPKVIGVDLSSRNIKFANSQLKNLDMNNASFLHADAAELKFHFTEKFDYSTVSYVIHEMPYEVRLTVLKAMREISNEIIIGDYFIPQPKNKRGYSNRIAEFLAGRDHFNNYRNFVKHNGIYGLVETLGMEILQEKIGVHGTSHVVRIR